MKAIGFILKLIGLFVLLAILFVCYSSYKAVQKTRNVVNHDDSTASSHATTPSGTYSGVDSKPAIPIWEIDHFVDEFGDQTNYSYMTNSGHISGTFSNSATNNSPLKVSIVIQKEQVISIMLYEYAGNNPVKAYSPTTYIVKVRAEDGTQSELKGYNSSDRINLWFASLGSRSDDGTRLHDMLIKHNKLKFLIYEQENTLTRYNFTVDATGYTSTYNRL